MRSNCVNDRIRLLRYFFLNESLLQLIMVPLAAGPDQDIVLLHGQANIGVPVPLLTAGIFYYNLLWFHWQQCRIKTSFCSMEKPTLVSRSLY